MYTEETQEKLVNSSRWPKPPPYTPSLAKDKRKLCRGGGTHYQKNA